MYSFCALPEKFEYTKCDNFSFLRFSILESHLDIDSHFPENPIIPAFMQLLWVQSLLQMQSEMLVLKRFFEVKFKNKIIPPCDLIISTEKISEIKYAFQITKENPMECFTRGKLELFSD